MADLVPDLRFDPPADEIGEALENNPEHKDLREAAWVWMEANPQIMALFRHYATAMASRRKPFGMKLLAERVRWECMITSRGDEGDGFYVNNNFTAYIARRLREEMPELRGLLRFRKTRW